MNGPKAHFNVTNYDGVHVVQFEDRVILEETVTQAITDELSRLAYLDAFPKLLLDFQRVEHISSAVLGMLVAIDRLFKRRNGRLVLAHLHSSIREVLQVTRFDQIFNIQDTTDDALKQFA